jgi:hypothetical protein
MPYETGRVSLDARGTSDAIDNLRFSSGYFGGTEDGESVDRGGNAVFKSAEGWELYLQQFMPGQVGTVTLVDGRDPGGARRFLLDARTDCLGTDLVVTAEQFSGNVSCQSESTDSGGGAFGVDITFEVQP